MFNFPLQFLSVLFGVIIGCSLIFFTNLSLQLSYQTEPNTAEIIQLPLVNENDLKESDLPFNINSVEERKDDIMYNKVRILCWVLTSPKNHEERGKVIRDTWGSRCNILLFMSTESDPTLPAIKLPVQEGRNQLWGKTQEAFRYVWNNYRDKADWFLKADDDTFVIMENLRYFLSGFDTTGPMWFGHKFKVLVEPQGYFSGGAGYVLSKEAVRRFVEIGYFDGIHCRHDHAGAEDAEMGRCMQYLNVSTMDTRDSKGRGRFFPFVPEDHYHQGDITQDYWYWNNIYYAPTWGKNCCSDSTVSFHYVSPNEMRTFYYLLYQLRPYGRQVDRRPSIPEPPPDLYLNETRWFAPTRTTTTTTATTTTPTTTSTTTSKTPTTTTSTPTTNTTTLIPDKNVTNRTVNESTTPTTIMTTTTTSKTPTTNTTSKTLTTNTTTTLISVTNVTNRTVNESLITKDKNTTVLNSKIKNETRVDPSVNKLNQTAT